jgi:hypothetical protein
MTMITILNEQREAHVAEADARGDSLWLNRADIELATGWTWKPEGLCRNDACIPLPQASPSLVQDGKLDIAEMWRHMGYPVAHDAARKTWVLGTGASRRRDTLGTLEAPDFELPNLEGRTHRLSDYRGKKVLLATWASW